MNPDEMGPGTGSLPLFDKVTAIIHKAVAAGKNDLLSKDNLNSLVHHLSRGQFPTYQSLLAAQQQHQSMLSQQEIAQASDPGALATFAGRGLEGATFGLAPKVMGAISPGLRQTFDQGVQTGSELHPMSGFAGEEAGGLASGIALGSAAGKLLPLHSIAPAARAALQGGAIGAVAGGAGGLAAQPGQDWNPGPALTGAGIGGLLGAFTGAASEGLISKLNAAPDVIHEMVQKASRPEAGSVSAGVGFKAGVKELERLSESLAGKSETLRRPMALVSRQLRQLTVQQARRSPAAADDAIATLTASKKLVADEYEALASHPSKGYDAVLGKVDLSTDPRAVTIARSQGYTGTPTGRWLEDLRQQLSGDVRTLQKQKATGALKVKNLEMKDKTQTIKQIESILEEVPGYTGLRQSVSPYLKYLQDSEGLLRELQRVRSRGAAPTAGGPLHEALSEAVSQGLGATKGLGTERTARGVVGSLVRAKSPHELLNLAEYSPPFTMTEPKWAGGLSGGLTVPLLRRLWPHQQGE